MTHRKYNRKRDKGFNTFCEENNRTDQYYSRGYQKVIFFKNHHFYKDYMEKN